MSDVYENDVQRVKVGNETAQVLLFGLDVLVEDAVGVHDGDRSHGAGTQASGLDDLDLV